MKTITSKDWTAQMWVIGLSLLFIVLGPWIESLSSVLQLLIILGIVSLVGIPHGATDYLIFQKISERDQKIGAWGPFIVIYLMTMGVYGLLWLLAPFLSLVIFLVISAYHFGQSNWHDKTGKNIWANAFIYLGWGSFVVLIPMFFHWEACAPILTALSGYNWIAFPSQYFLVAASGLFLINLAISTGLYFKDIIDERRWLLELGSLILLGLLFWRTPLLVGFAIYFGIWHSLGSLVDQLYHFRKIDPSIQWKSLGQAALPYTVAALLGLALFAFVPAGQANEYLAIGGGLVFISLVTMPHMILIEHLYEQKPIVVTKGINKILKNSYLEK